MLLAQEPSHPRYMSMRYLVNSASCDAGHPTKLRDHGETVQLGTPIQERCSHLVIAAASFASSSAVSVVLPFVGEANAR